MTASLETRIVVLLGSACLAGFAPAASAGVRGLAAAAATVHVTVISPTHKPKVNVPWPVKVRVTNAAGKPIAATLTMQVMFEGAAVGKIDNGAVYHFVGTWQEKAGNEITWPADSRGEPLTLQFVVKAEGVTVRKNWAITVS